mmetsp:Transcript_84383/g.149224  ORF Transcript_84383/g.149224 Transcript_84383/m.149224 type:complete len:462 (+) Transcript_84383:63-1448(+)
MGKIKAAKACLGEGKGATTGKKAKKKISPVGNGKGSGSTRPLPAAPKDSQRKIMQYVVPSSQSSVSPATVDTQHADMSSQTQRQLAIDLSSQCENTEMHSGPQVLLQQPAGVQHTQLDDSALAAAETQPGSPRELLASCRKDAELFKTDRQPDWDVKSLATPSRVISPSPCQSLTAGGAMNCRFFQQWAEELTEQWEAEQHSCHYSEGESAVQQPEAAAWQVQSGHSEVETSRGIPDVVAVQKQHQAEASTSGTELLSGTRKRKVLPAPPPCQTENATSVSSHVRRTAVPTCAPYLGPMEPWPGCTGGDATKKVTPRPTCAPEYLRKSSVPSESTLQAPLQDAAARSLPLISASTMPEQGHEVVASLIPTKTQGCNLPMRAGLNPARRFFKPLANGSNPSRPEAKWLAMHYPEQNPFVKDTSQFRDLSDTTLQIWSVDNMACVNIYFETGRIHVSGLKPEV